MIENSGTKIFEKILKYVELKNKSILEIGCGKGRISSFLSQETKFLVAIDPDENAITDAKANISNVDFKVGSGELLNFPNSNFDFVLFTLSLHHQNSLKALAEATRVVKKDGIIIVVEPVIEGEIEVIFSFLHNENREKIFAQNSINNSGLSILETEVFTANWVFKDEIDLFKSIFEYYDMPFDSFSAQNISNYLGAKLKSCPIVCEDKMVIQTLKIAQPVAPVVAKRPTPLS